MPAAVVILLYSSMVLAESVVDPGWAPMTPFSIFGTSADELVQQKGRGQEQYASSAEGKFLASLEYGEKWFGSEKPLRVEYVLTLGDPLVVMQLTIHFHDGTDRDVLINQISTYLGMPRQGKSDEGAPSVYFANWIHDGVRYDLQDYGDYKEMYVSKSRFSPTDRYKLSEETLVFQRKEAFVHSDTAKNTVLLLGIQNDGPLQLMDTFSLFIQHSDDDEFTGTVMPLPETSAKSIPKLEFHDFDGDKLDDAFISFTAASGREAGCVVARKDGKPTVIFDSEKTATTSIKPGEYASIKPTDVNGDGTYELAVERPGAVLRWEEWRWVEQQP